MWLLSQNKPKNNREGGEQTSRYPSGNGSPTLEVCPKKQQQPSMPSLFENPFFTCIGMRDSRKGISLSNKMAKFTV